MANSFKHMAMWTWPDSVVKEDPQRLVERLQAAHVDIIIPYICGSRDGYSWTSGHYDDCLRKMIDAAHRGGLKIHACFDEVNAYKTMPAYGWRQVRQDGSIASVLCHANPAVQDFVLAQLRRVLTEFDYDGINLEDGYIYHRTSIYDPAHQVGEKYRVVPVCYCELCRNHAPIENPEWAEWKREQLNALIGREAALIRQMKPGMPFSVAARMPYDCSFYAPFAAEMPYYEGWQICQSRDGLGADWAEWLRRGYLDFACPMSYFHSRRLVELETRECQSLIRDAGQKIWVGLGLGECTAEYLQGSGDDPTRKDAKDPALRNDGEAMRLLLEDQQKMGQENVVFFCYQYLLDEHLPVLASFR